MNTVALRYLPIPFIVSFGTAPVTNITSFTGRLFMPRSKRSSKVIEQARQRAAGLASISATLDLGNGRTLKAFNADIDDAQEKLDA